MTDQPVSQPELTEFEQRLSVEIDRAWDKGSGTVWKATAAVLARELGMPPLQVGAISVTTDNVIYNRPVSPGLIRNPRRVLLIPVAASVGLSRQAQAVRDLMPLTRHLQTVALAEQRQFSSGPVWRVVRILQSGAEGDGELVRVHFPAVARVEVVTHSTDDTTRELPLEDTGTDAVDAATDAENTVDSADAIDARLEVTSIDEIVDRVLVQLAAEKVVLPDQRGVAHRCVVGLLTGHLVLQGPPGTAKTTLARILCGAFGATNERVTATADWTTYDVVGGYRPARNDENQEVLGTYEGCVTRALRLCAKTVEESLDPVAGAQAAPAHWLVIDELNRAEIDKAIGPLYSVLGNDNERDLELWFDDEEPKISVPRRFRIIATLNDVDTSFAYSLSQGLSRRFTFVNLAVAQTVSDEERDAAFNQAAAWVYDNYPALLDGKTAAEAVPHLYESAEGSVKALRDLVNRIRSGGTRTFPLGTAQLIDIARQLMMSLGDIAELPARLDGAVADIVVPQLGGLGSVELRELEAFMKAADFAWDAAGRRLRTLSDPLSTV